MGLFALQGSVASDLGLERIADQAVTWPRSPASSTTYLGIHNAP